MKPNYQSFLWAIPTKKRKQTNKVGFLNFHPTSKQKATSEQANKKKQTNIYMRESPDVSCVSILPSQGWTYTKHRRETDKRFTLIQHIATYNKNVISDWASTKCN